MSCDVVGDYRKASEQRVFIERKSENNTEHKARMVYFMKPDFVPLARF